MPLEIQMSSSPFRVALVGLGDVASHLHLPAIAGLSEARLVGACDIDAPRRQSVAGRWNVPTFDDVDAMLAKTRPEVVVVGTPPHLHAEHCQRSLAAGAHVICEKPFASSVAEANQVIEAARAAGRRVAVNHEYRQMPIFQAVLNAVAAPRSPEVRFAQLWQLIDLPQSHESGWRGAMVYRSLYEAGVHLLDYALALFRERPVAVSAVMSSAGSAASMDAAALVTLEFSRGRLAQITQYRLGKGANQYFELRAETARESLRASFGGRARLSVGLYRSTIPHLRIEYGSSGVAWREAGSRRHELARNPRNPLVIATREVFSKTLQAFRDGTDAPTSDEQARDVLEVIAACYLSASSGSRVRLDHAETNAELAQLAMGGQSAR